jgi:hypothetical protein
MVAPSKTWVRGISFAGIAVLNSAGYLNFFLVERAGVVFV